MIQQKNKESKELDELQLLLAGPEKEHIDFMKIISPNCKISQDETKLGERIATATLEKETKTRIVTELEIKRECRKFYLEFIPLNKYEGDYSIDFIKELKEYLNDTNIQINDYDLKHKLFAIFPIRGGEKIDRGKSCKNPTILYQHERINYDSSNEIDRSTKYSIIHKGQNYVNLNNLMLSLIHRNQTTNMIYIISMLFLNIACIFMSAIYSKLFFIFSILSIIYNIYFYYKFKDTKNINNRDQIN